MEDVVDRLRSKARDLAQAFVVGEDPRPSTSDLLREAADVIERVRQAAAKAALKCPRCDLDRVP